MDAFAELCLRALSQLCAAVALLSVLCVCEEKIFTVPAKIFSYLKYSVCSERLLGSRVSDIQNSTQSSKVCFCVWKLERFSRFIFFFLLTSVHSGSCEQSDSENGTSQTSEAAVCGATEPRRGPEPPAAPNRQRSPNVDQTSSSSTNGRTGTLESDPCARRGSNLAQRVAQKTEEKPSTATSVPKASRPPQSGSTKDGDDISVGLASLMGRARTKEHRTRARAAERKDTQVEGQQRNDESETPSEEPKPSTPSGPSSPQAPKTDPLAPPVGFLPPKPVAKPNPLAPPPGFIPPPKPNPSTQATPDPLAPPAGFVPAPKRDPFAPVAGFIPKPKVDPLAPPAGFIPAPRITAVRKPEVQERMCV